MTIVVGFDWLTETVMIADTRISWENNQFPPKDILRKLYTLEDSKKSAVLGFSGELYAAKKVMTFLIKQKFLGYKRPFIISQFRDDLRQWIEKIIAKLTPKQRKELSFMLCGIEPSRRPAILEDGKITGYTPFTESHIYVYTIGENGNVRVNKKPKGFAIIGTGRKLRKEVIEQVQETIHFGFNDPKLHWARAALISEIVASLAKENKAVSPTVGGPFQVIRITPDGLKTDYTWPPDVDSKNVEIRIEGSKTIVHNPALGESYVLHSIWDSPF